MQFNQTNHNQGDVHNAIGSAPNAVGGVATILGQRFAFPVDAGYGLVVLGGRFAIVQFSCPLETLPPQGEGHVVTSTDTYIVLENGQLFFNDEPLYLGVQA